MKKGYSLLFLAGAITLSASAQDKFDATGRMVMDTYKSGLLNPDKPVALANGLSVTPSALSARSSERVSFIVSFNEGGSVADLEVRGFEIHADLDDMAVASGTMADIAALEECDFVKALSFGAPVTPKLDLARKGTGVDLIHKGTGLSTSYKGKGVIAGIYDVGIDPNHANFSTGDGKTTRVARLWHFNSNDGSNIEYTSATVSRFKTDNQKETHGTHTLGCMTGAYNKRCTSLDPQDVVALIDPETNTVSTALRNVNPYYGMAPEAEIAAGCGALYDPNTTTAVTRIRDYAKAQGKPAVVNLSIGSTIGPHDGTDLTSQALERLGKDVIICISAGNEGDLKMSVAKTLSSSDTELKTFAYGTNNTIEFVEFWSDSSTPFTVTPVLYDRASKKVLYEYNIDKKSLGGGQYAKYADGSDANLVRAYQDFYLKMSTSTNSGTNKRYSASIQIMLNFSQANSSRNQVLGFKIKGQAGQKIMGTTNSNTIAFNNLGVAGYTDGTSEFSINSMATAKNVVAVGAWNTRFYWPTVSGGVIGYSGNEGFEVDEVAGYSSYGVLLDGRSLPHVCAPGSGIISSISTYYVDDNISSNPSYRNYLSVCQTVNGRKNYWEAQQGTSMASPVVAGGIALWLQYKPSLTVNEVLKAIEVSSVKDKFVNAGPKVQWGAGKFNAYQGLKYLIDPAGVDDVVVDGIDDAIIAPCGPSQWEIFVPYADRVQAELYSLSGVHVASAAADGDTLTFDGSDLAKGIYVINVNGRHSRKLQIK